MASSMSADGRPCAACDCPLRTFLSKELVADIVVFFQAKNSVTIIFKSQLVAKNYVGLFSDQILE